jgi:hypothetical protein
MAVTTVRKPRLGSTATPFAGLASAAHGVNPQTGQAYTAQPAPGGTRHVYANGRSVFVPAKVAESPTPFTATRAPAPAASAPAAPTPAQNPTAPPDTTGQSPDYKDAGYYAGATAAQQRRDAGYAANEAEKAKNLAAKEAALSALAAQQPKDEQSTKETNNDKGLFYSGHLGQDLSDLAASYTTRRTGATQAFTDAEAARAAGRLGIDASYSSDLAGLADAAIARQSDRDAAAAEAGRLAAPPPEEPLAAAPVPAATQTIQQNPGKWVQTVFYKGGKKWYRYGDGTTGPA